MLTKITTVTFTISFLKTTNLRKCLLIISHCVYCTMKYTKFESHYDCEQKLFCSQSFFFHSDMVQSFSQMESFRIWRHRNHPHERRDGLGTRHTPVQQVRKSSQFKALNAVVCTFSKINLFCYTCI